MAKAAIGYSGATFGTAGSAGLPAVYSTAVTVAVTFTPHQNPDHSSVKDTRS